MRSSLFHPSADHPHVSHIRTSTESTAFSSSFVGPPAADETPCLIVTFLRPRAFIG